MYDPSEKKKKNPRPSLKMKTRMRSLPLQPAAQTSLKNRNQHVH
jgi:hypothetical protein